MNYYTDNGNAGNAGNAGQSLFPLIFLPGQPSQFDICHVTDYIRPMIKTFADKYTKELYETGKSRKFPPDIHKRGSRKLEYVDHATCLEDLKAPRGNRLHKLSDDREGQHAIAINDQWRICFRFAGGDAWDVEVCDYH